MCMCLAVYLSISVSNIGNNTLWIIGDNFAARSFRAHFKKHTPSDYTHFIKQNFEYHPFCSSRFSSPNGNMLSRISGTFANALNGNVKTGGGLLPQYILMVLDDDLITFLNCRTSDGVASLFGIWITWLVDDINRMLKVRFNQLPTKGKKVTPFIYWVTAPIHSYFSKERNNLRIKFNLSLESVIRQQENMRVIKMKQFWESKDSHLVINDRMTESGLTAYWMAVDATFKYNSQRHEAYVAKKLLSKQQSPTDTARPSSASMGSAPKFRNDSSPEWFRVSEDPMRGFFRRHRPDYHMGSREDSHRRREVKNRFMLPRIR